MQRRQSLFAFVLLCAAIFLGVGAALAQVNTATLSGSVTDQQGLVVRGAKITVTNAATGAERNAAGDENGHYTIVGLVPGEYKVHVEGGSNFAPYEIPALEVRVGSEAIVNVVLTIGTQTQTVTVTTESAPIETTRSESAQTVEERQIDSLPINGRNYINFTLTNSQTLRDNSNAIGPAPNSGLSISGARARGNMVSVDGADAVDNSVNGIRSTVSQEAVQEFQMILSNYNAEYGRASGGVVNIVTKSGSNDFHGDVFGYLRNKAFQARNPFSFDVNPSTGNLDPIKQGYTRVQTGVTLGGALKKDKTFYFFSYEYTQREETGFSSIGQGNFGLTTGAIPCLAVPLSMTPSQLGFYQAALGAVGCASPQTAGLLQAAVVTGATTNAAVKRDLNINVDGTPIPMSGLLYGAAAAALPNSHFFPGTVTCPVGTQVNNIICIPPTPTSTVGIGFVPLPASYVGLDAIRGNFPEMEKTSLWSLRLDQHWSKRNTSFLRIGVSPSEVTGIQSTSQNQVVGQNSGTRVGESHYRDFNATFQNDTILSDTAFNEFRFQFARRGAHFGYSPLDYSSIGGGKGSDIGVNIPGYGYFGREPYSTVDRIERRFEFTDNGTITHGRHTFKVGADYNLVQLRSAKPQIFELDFGGDVNFGAISAFPAGIPELNALQAYGLGIPNIYIQGIGSSHQTFDNIPIGFFGQDSWRMTRTLTVNYGLRYDVELSPLFAPATAINAAAEKALSVVEGIPRNYKNVAPRFGIAWDPAGNGKTVVRAGYGLFYDHPLLAVAFDAVTADGGRSVQLITPGSSLISACGLVTPVCGNGLDTPLNLNGSSIFQGVLNAASLPSSFPSMHYLPNEQRFDPFPPDSLFANQNYLTAGYPLPILPFTLPVVKNFKYGYAQQANLTIERVIAGNWKISAGYQWTRGLHLNRPVDVNPVDPVLLTNNLANADAAGLGFTNPSTVIVPSSDTFPTAKTCGLFVSATSAPGILGVLGGCPAALASFDGKFVGTPAFFNYFRKSGPNPSFATALAAAPGSPCAPSPTLACGFALQQALATAAGFPVGFGVPVPYLSVDAQKSDAFSTYNALTINLEKRFSRHFQLLSSYTWSHSIDDGTDLQSTLEPADSRFPQYEKGNSVNDQRHRWVTSGVFMTSPHVAGQSFMNSFFSNFTFAPIIEAASGRPFNVITGTDTLGDGGSSDIRPSVVPAGTLGAITSPYIKGFAFVGPTVCKTDSGAQAPVILGITPPFGCTGNLGRNRFVMPNFYQVDLRISKGINLGERVRMDLIADGFNLFNHSNFIGANQLCDPLSGACPAGQPSAAADARQFQFALKLNW